MCRDKLTLPRACPAYTHTHTHIFFFKEQPVRLGLCRSMPVSPPHTDFKFFAFLMLLPALQLYKLYTDAFPNKKWSDWYTQNIKKKSQTTNNKKIKPPLPPNTQTKRKPAPLSISVALILHIATIREQSTSSARFLPTAGTPGPRTPTQIRPPHPRF